MKAIHKRRLLKLARFLREKVPSEFLNMRVWIEPDRKGRRHRRASLKCGTPACAAGWATAIFPELYYDDKLRIKGKRYKSAVEISSWDALEEFFGLNKKQSGYLFGAYGGRTIDKEADLLEGVANGAPQGSCGCCPAASFEGG